MRRLKELELLILLVLNTDEKSIPLRRKTHPTPAQCGRAEAVPFVRLSPQHVMTCDQCSGVSELASGGAESESPI
jgi:hypothetical protein